VNVDIQQALVDALAPVASAIESDYDITVARGFVFDATAAIVLDGWPAEAGDELIRLPAAGHLDHNRVGAVLGDAGPDSRRVPAPEASRAATFWMLRPLRPLPLRLKSRTTVMELKCA